MKSNMKYTGTRKNSLSKTILLTMTLLCLIFTTGALYAASLEKRPELLFHSIDVGQGDCSLFILPDGRTVLIDAGPEEAAKDVVKHLRKHGVDKIDLLVATHAHSDHIGGMKAILANFRVEKVWDSGFIHGGWLQSNFYKTIQRRNIRFGRPKRGFTENMGGVLIEVLAPSVLLKGTGRDTNNNCLVLRLSYGNVSFLMTGDMERAEYATIRPLAQSTVLKASHHGSSNGTDNRLLREVNPSLIILSYGKYNTHGYPHREVVRAIAQRGIKRLDTKDGTIEIRTDGVNLTYPDKRGVM